MSIVSSASASSGIAGQSWRRWLGGASKPRPAPRGRVIALHCSGAGAGQWRALAAALGPGYELTAPEHYGCDGTGPWTGAHAFTLADEAARTIALIDRSDAKVHLVGHSYGGGVALNVALARPGRIASLTLYEPSAFHLLKTMGLRAMSASEEIAAIAYEVGERVTEGDFARAAVRFVDYWGGAGAWAALRPSVQAALVRWAPKAPLDFRALMTEPTPPAAYAGLAMPCLVLRGEHAPRPTRLIAELLATRLPAARLAALEGAGHMGPLTHAAAVNELIVAHVNAAEAALRAARAPGPGIPAARPSPATAHRRPEAQVSAIPESAFAAFWLDVVGWKSWRALLDSNQRP